MKNRNKDDSKYLDKVKNIKFSLTVFDFSISPSVTKMFTSPSAQHLIYTSGGYSEPPDPFDPQ